MKTITTRSVKWAVRASDEPVHSDALTFVEIIDEGAGEFVQISNNDEHGLTIKVSQEEWPELYSAIKEEWPELYSAISHAIAICQEAKP